jgi:hypothetical protein
MEIAPGREKRRDVIEEAKRRRRLRRSRRLSEVAARTRRLVRSGRNPRNPIHPDGFAMIEQLAIGHSITLMVRRLAGRGNQADSAVVEFKRDRWSAPREEAPGTGSGNRATCSSKDCITNPGPNGAFRTYPPRFAGQAKPTPYGRG